MSELNPYEVKEEDFKALEDIFKKALTDINTFANIDIILREQLEDFVVNVGISVKEILQKCVTDNQIKALEVKQHQEDVMKYKHRDVKRELKLKQVENAMNAFKRVK